MSSLLFITLTGEKEEGRPYYNHKYHLDYYSTSSANADLKIMANVSSSGSNVVIMSKKDRKKLKKLKKRVINMRTDGERSGLLTVSEYKEYQELVKECATTHTSSMPGEAGQDEDDCAQSSLYPPACPSINFRKKRLGCTTNQGEGVHHRDLIAWILQQQRMSLHAPSSAKKRRREDDKDSKENSDIPYFVSIHNPSTCERVAVVEFHVSDEKIDRYREFLESLHCTKTIRTNHHQNQKVDGDRTVIHHPRTQLGIETKWFQGHQPKSMSESLLYFLNSKIKEKEKGTNTNHGRMNNSDHQQSTTISYIERLESMTLSLKERVDEGYPIPPSPSSPFNDDQIQHVGNKRSSIKFDLRRKDKIESPDSVSLETANKFIEAFGMRIQGQKINDDIAYIGTLKDTSTTTNYVKDGRGGNGDIVIENECNNKSPVRIFGLDCEMVLTTVGSELARLTLVQLDKYVGPKRTTKTTVLIDCLVRPRNKIIDYLTAYSGVTAKLIEPVSTRIEQVQYALATYLKPDDILVGHSLENDLRALHYVHSRVVDTSMIFRPLNKNKRFKFSLRHLSGVLLRKKIQNGSHCSKEDAQASLEIALLKAFTGESLQVPGCRRDDDRQCLLQKQFMKKTTSVFIGPKLWLENHITNNPNSAHALSYDAPNDCKKAILSWVTGQSTKARLIWSQIVLNNHSNIEKSTSKPNAELEIFKSIVVSF